MNAKTTKFLAVFAVLAMAFAAVAVFAPVESDAVEAQSVWTTDAGANWSLTLGSDAIIPTDGQTIDGKKVYYVNTDMSLVMSKDADLSVGGTLILLKSGVNVKVQVPQTHEKTIAFAVAGVDESEDAKGNTVLTFYGDYTGSAFQNWVGTGGKGFAYPTCWYGDGDNYIIGNQTIGLSKENGGGNFEFESGITVDGKEKKVVYMAYTDTECAWYLDQGFFANTFQYIYQYGEPDEEDGAIWNFMDATGTIGSYMETNKIKLDGFTGVVKMTDDEEIVIVKWISGDIEVIEGTFILGTDEYDDPVMIAEGSKVFFPQGTTIPANFTVSFGRYVVDVYTFTNTAAVKAGVGGFTIAPGENGFELSGNIDGAPSWTFEGAASFTGVINAGNAAVSITADANYDFTFKSATVYTSKLTLTNGAAIADDAVVQINKGLTVGAGTLKIGDGAYVRVYGELTTPKIYSAGNVVADTMTIGTDPVKTDKAYSGAFVYKDGSIKVSDLKLTKLEQVRMAYVYLTGAGVLGVNGVTVINNDAVIGGTAAEPTRTGGYYYYSCMVFYPVATQDVLNLKAQSGIVGGIETDADLLSEPDVNLDLQYAKYKINYETRTPTFVIEYKETYKVILDDVSKKYTITDSEGKSVYIASDDQETFYAMLIYGEAYNLNGKDEKNKYTYTSDINDKYDVKDYLQPFDYESPILTIFEQTRMEQTISVDVGLAQTIYIKVSQETTDPAVAVGDLILTYSVDGEEYDVYAANIEAKLDGNKTEKFLGATFTIYNTDRVLVKLDDKKYFFEVPVVADIVGLEFDEPAEEESDAGWQVVATAEVPGDGDGASVLGVVPIQYTLAAVDDTYLLKNYDNVTGDIQITIEFEDYYQGTSGHEQSITLKLTKDEAKKYTKNFYVGETYTMTWEEVNGVKYRMTYPDYDKDNKPLVYEKEDLVEVIETTEDAKGTAYTLMLTKIRYADIENKTNLDLIVTYGDSEITIKKGEKRTGENGLPLDASYPDSTNPATNPNLTYEDHYLVLTAKGYAITSWTGKYLENSTATTAKTIAGSGPSSTTVLTGLVEGGSVTIASIQATQNLYQVMVDDVQRPNVGDDYTRTGHYGDTMYLFPTADPGQTVYGIEVYLADPENPGQPGAFHCLAKESEDGSFSYYTMPDSDVVLNVIVDKSTYDVTFVNQDGVQVGETQKVEPYSEHTLTIPAQFGYVATAVDADVEIEGGLGFDPETQTVNFEMPAEDVVITVTYDEGGPFSEDMELFISKTTNGVKITIIANDDLPIQSGYITIDYWYVYEEDGIYGMEQVVLDPVEFATSGAGVIESITLSLAEEEFFGAIYYVSATFEPIDGDAMKSDYIAYQMA